MSRTRFRWLRGGKYFKENMISFEPGILLKNDCYLDGHWQNAKYFTEIEEIIRDRFRFDLPLSEENRKFCDLISSNNSVSIYIRRGDYLNAQEFHGLCSQDYYQQAMWHIEQHVARPCYFVFSDDLEWARQYLDLTIDQCSSTIIREMRVLWICG
jgi:hypothetical protein